MKQGNTESYWFYRNRGMCPMCSGRNKARPGKAYCEDCAQKYKKYEWHGEDGYVRNFMRRYREKRKGAGLCAICGKKPPEKGRVNCQQCLDRAREKYIGRAKRLEAQGLCIVCGKQEPKNGKRTCDACLQKKRDARKRNDTGGQTVMDNTISMRELSETTGIPHSTIGVALCMAKVKSNIGFKRYDKEEAKQCLVTYLEKLLNDATKRVELLQGRLDRAKAI